MTNDGIDSQTLTGTNKSFPNDDEDNGDEDQQILQPVENVSVAVETVEETFADGIPKLRLRGKTKLPKRKKKPKTEPQTNKKSAEQSEKPPVRQPTFQPNSMDNNNRRITRGVTTFNQGPSGNTRSGRR